MKIFIVYFFLFLSMLQAREIGQTEITTEEGMEYIKKKNIIY